MKEDVMRPKIRRNLGEMKEGGGEGERMKVGGLGEAMGKRIRIGVGGICSHYELCEEIAAPLKRRKRKVEIWLLQRKMKKKEKNKKYC